ncbi:MAG TPA: bifunctional precorrin-2 dehydrogenase/sirohydrochlorin ferrochelatase [Anaerohalosphaeraceae bacterium]|nr:bifunctional precorrin-2 dehydrogenase/sirohydrochlorin ferrochelatase [Anaerohalosphaeraceae bacterium]HOL89209.1 bifunctional precorrin-2 dehydrogenase/sirohydrochlorin ferrochelatase [Anaerohalosphaeraceae bacterium]HPP56295.1 bifunctional precorrin-2 dehydrogenase/sirohydrochlorin ferrochelatase [Anaerohalosphaeraceae bacterium]
MAKYPIFLEMAGRRAVVIGGGPVALRKVQGLAEAGARVTVVAEHILPEIEEVLIQLNAEIILSRYRKDFLVSAALVIAATNNPDLNRRIYEDCQELEILCNVVDQPELCDFFVPAVVKRGDLQIAIGTEGHCPAYAGHLRQKLEEIFTDAHGRFVDELAKVRTHIIETIPDSDQRKALLGKLASDESFHYFAEHGPEGWRRHCDEMIRQCSV